jgi:uncharacterized protein (TIGR03000 family)
MNKRMILGSVAAFLALALVVTPAFAQRGGGGRGGGGGGRGWGGGGRSWGGSYGGYGRGYGGYGNYGRGYGYGGYGRGYGYGLGGYGLGYGLGYYGGYYGDGYGYDGSYAQYPYNSGFYASQPYVAQPMIANTESQAQPLSNYQLQDPASSGTAPTVAMQSFYSGPSTSPGKAELTVKVPANAQLWLGTMLSGQQGTERHFSFPALPQGDNWFTLRSTWTDNGQTVTREKKVNMKGGANSSVDFTKATDEKAQPADQKAGQPMPTGTVDEKKKDAPLLPTTGIPKK